MYTGYIFDVKILVQFYAYFLCPAIFEVGITSDKFIAKVIAVKVEVTSKQDEVADP